MWKLRTDLLNWFLQLDWKCLEIISGRDSGSLQFYGEKNIYYTDILFTSYLFAFRQVQRILNITPLETLENVF